LIVLVSTVYLNTLSNGFVSDDGFQIFANPWIKGAGRLVEIFSGYSGAYSGTTLQKATYRPLMYVVFMAEYALFGLGPRGWHAVNILFHILNVILVFFIASFLIRTFHSPLRSPSRSNDQKGPFTPPLTAIIAAALFATHPAASETVSWVSAMPELGFTFLVLLSFYTHIRSGGAGRDSGKETQGRSALSYSPAAALFFLALLFKETAVAILPLVFIYDILRDKKISIKGLKRYLPYGAAFGAYTIIRISVLGHFTPATSFNSYMSGPQFFLNGATGFIKALRMLVYPVHDYPFQIFNPVLSILDPWAIVSIPMTVVIIIAFFFLRKKVSPLYILAASFIVLPVLPALYTPAVSRFGFAQRYLYLSSVGYGLFAALLLKGISTRGPFKNTPALRGGVIALTALMILLYSYRTATANLFWRDNLTLARSALKGSPDNYFALFQIGNELSRKKAYGGAINAYKKSIAILQERRYQDRGILKDARMGLANAYFSAAMTEDALREYSALTKSYPPNPSVKYRLGYIYQQKGLCGEAINYYASAFALFKKPSNIRDSLINMGNCLIKEKRYEEARSSYLKALRVTPGDPLVLNNLKILEGFLQRNKAGAFKSGEKP